MSKVKFKVVREVRAEVIKLEDGKEYVLTIKGPIRIGAAAPAGSGRERNADVAPVLNHDDNKEGVIIVNAALRSQLVESYPADGYVGKTFAITPLGKAPGKRYKSFKIQEVELAQ